MNLKRDSKQPKGISMKSYWKYCGHIDAFLNLQ